MTTIIVTLVETVCASCGCIFGLAEGHEDQLRRTGRSFYCPNGHSLSFNHSLESKIKDLKKELAEEKAEREYFQKSLKAEEQEHKSTKKALSSTKANLTKIKKRVGNGVCPCCHKTFKQLSRHMSSKHPEYKND